MRACVCVCVFSVGLSGLVKNSCGEAEDRWLNHFEAGCTEEKVWTNSFLSIGTNSKAVYNKIIFIYFMIFRLVFLKVF